LANIEFVTVLYAHVGPDSRRLLDLHRQPISVYELDEAWQADALVVRIIFANAQDAWLGATGKDLHVSLIGSWRESLSIRSRSPLLGLEKSNWRKKLAPAS
jgi:hypothetical protein